MEGEGRSGPPLHLPDLSQQRADVFIVAHGTTANAPAPWGDGVGVDETMRAAHLGLYAAGGAAIHHDERIGTWRIDHWGVAGQDSAKMAETETRFRFRPFVEAAGRVTA